MGVARWQKSAESPLTLKRGEAGEHVVSAELEGRQSVKRTITVKARGEQLMMVLSLPELKVAVAPVDAGTEDRRHQHRREGQHAEERSALAQHRTRGRVTENVKSLGDTRR